MNTPAPGAVRIHVNQVALERSGPKRAVVTVDAGAQLERVTVIAADGSPVATAEIEESPGFTEWGAGLQHYIADFSGLTDNHAHAMVDEKAAPDRRTGMNLDTGQPA